MKVATTILATLALAASADAAEPIAPRCAANPILTTTDGAHKRAERGWDSQKLREREGTQRRVRLQAQCVPDGRPERYVRAQIKQARTSYKYALEHQDPYPDPTTLPDYDSLTAIWQCETGSQPDPPTTNTGNGYYGMFQFDLRTWGEVGGVGLPSDASVSEQYFRAQQLLSTAGSGRWPNCP